MSERLVDRIPFAKIVAVLSTVFGISLAVRSYICSFFRQPEQRRLLDRFRNAGVDSHCAVCGRVGADACGACDTFDLWKLFRKSVTTAEAF